MLHLRIISPPATTEAVGKLLTEDDAVTHVVVLPGTARDPVGDLVPCDVVREGARRCSCSSTSPRSWLPGC